MHDVIVLGSGLFGMVTAAALRSDGHDVLVIDDRRPSAGSIPAACLIKPSWVSGLGAKIVDPSMRLLDELYGVQDLRFHVGPITTGVHWVDPRLILTGPDLVDSVEQVTEDGGVGYVRTRNSGVLSAGRVVVALGFWCNEVLPPEMWVHGLSGRAGVAYTVDGQIERPFIHPWAPYKQLVAFNRTEEEIWVGDGTSIMPSNWTPKRERESLERSMKSIDRDPSTQHRRLYGIRPYVSGAKPCYLRHHGPISIVTGGAKNGTLAAAWCADQIRSLIR